MAGYKNKSKSSSKGRKVKSKSKSKSKSSPVPVQQQTIEIGNETLVTTVRALAQAGGGFANMLMTALAAAVAGAGGQPLPAGTRFVIQPWASSRRCTNMPPLSAHPLFSPERPDTPASAITSCEGESAVRACSPKAIFLKGPRPLFGRWLFLGKRRGGFRKGQVWRCPKEA